MPHSAKQPGGEPAQRRPAAPHPQQHLPPRAAGSAAELRHLRAATVATDRAAVLRGLPGHTTDEQLRRAGDGAEWVSRHGPVASAGVAGQRVQYLAGGMEGSQ